MDMVALESLWREIERQREGGEREGEVLSQLPVVLGFMVVSAEAPDPMERRQAVPRMIS